jgi:hypothetical protein
VLTSTRKRVFPRLDSLESRTALSSGSQINTIATQSGSVATPDGTGLSTVEISPSFITPGRRTTVLALTVLPQAGSSVQPRIVSVLDGSGKPLSIRLQAPFTPHHQQANALVYDPTGGPISTVVVGQHGSVGGFNVVYTLPGDVNGAGRVSPSDAISFSTSFNKFSYNAFYNKAADANSNGYVGIGDGSLLQRNLTPPKVEEPLTLNIQLSKKDQVIPVQGSISGGETYHAQVTVQGRTMPGSMLYLDDPNLNNFTFTGLAIPTNSKGFFSYTEKLDVGLTSNDIQVISPFGQKLKRVFPILRLKP